MERSLRNSMTPNYEYAAKLVRVVDGDTVVLTIDLGFKIEIEMVCRVYGVNTPELIGVDRVAALAAKEATENMLTTEAIGGLFTRTHKPNKDKYGRYLAEIFYTNAKGEVINLGEQLIARGFAVPYMV